LSGFLHKKRTKELIFRKKEVLLATPKGALTVTRSRLDGLAGFIGSGLPGSCGNLIQAVIPSEARSRAPVILSGAKNLALSIYNAARDSSSPAAPRNDRL